MIRFWGYLITTVAMASFLRSLGLGFSPNFEDMFKIMQLAMSDLYKMKMARKACLRVILALFRKQNDPHITYLTSNVGGQNKKP